MSAPRGFVGTAAVFWQRTAIGNPKSWGFWEEVAPGAFDRALRDGDDVRLLLDHNPSLLLARTRSGTLRLSADGSGLQVRADLPDTQLGRDTATMIARRDLSQMSFGFYDPTYRWTTLPDGTELGTILSVGELADVAPVTFPAYAGTKADLDWRGELDRLRALGEQIKRAAPPAALTDRERREKALLRLRHLEARIRLDELQRRPAP